jgi:hypothetical protein
MNADDMKDEQRRERMPMSGGELELTRAEVEQLKKTGYCEIDDAERGHIEVRVHRRPGAGWRGAKLRMKVLRSGTAAVMKFREQ